MRKFAIAAVAVLAIAGSTAVYAQHRHWDHGHWGYGHMRMSPEDRAAFADARIAAVRAGLKLTADQEKLWPPVEDAIRNAARLHVSHMQAMRDRADDPIERLRNAADRMAQGSDAMRKLADAAAPLYATLDDAQKRRLRILVRDMGPRSMMGRGWRGMMGGRFDSDDRDERRGMMGQGSGQGMGSWFGSDDEDDDQ